MLTVQLSEAFRDLPPLPEGYTYTTMGMTSRKFMTSVYQDVTLTTVEAFTALENKIAARLTLDYFPFVRCANFNDVIVENLTSTLDANGWGPWVS